MAHANRSQNTVRLTDLERRALIGILDDAIARMVAVGRKPDLLRRIRQKIADTGV
jgi:hypothetical protein